MQQNPYKCYQVLIIPHFGNKFLLCNDCRLLTVKVYIIFHKILIRKRLYSFEIKQNTSGAIGKVNPHRRKSVD